MPTEPDVLSISQFDRDSSDCRVSIGQGISKDVYQQTCTY